MGREAQALLRVQVQDEDLVKHAERLEKVKAAWQSMAGLHDSLTKAVPPDMVKGLQDLATTLQGPVTADIRDFANAAKSLKTTAGPLATSVAKMADALQKVGPALMIVGLHGKAARDAFESLNKAINAASIKAMRDMATATAKTGTGLTKVGTGGHKAAEGLDDYVRSVKDAAAAGVPVNASINQITQAQQRNEKQVGRLTRAYRMLSGISASITRSQQNLIRNASLLFIGYHWARGLTEQLRMAAQEMDLNNTLTQSVEGFTTKMKEANRALQGTVTNLKLMKSMALMSSFGIPLENFAAQMEMVSKMAIRTGQSTDYLAESLARGVSRLSPMILDNLGLQISLKKSYDTYAASLGISSSALDENQKKQAVMNEVLRQSARLVKDVDIGGSFTTQVEQASVVMEEFAASIRTWVLSGIATAFQTAEQATRTYLSTLKALRKEMKETGAGTGEVDVLQDFAERYPGVLSKGQMLLKHIHLGYRSLLGAEETTLRLTEKQIAKEIEYKEQQLERIKVSKALMDIDADLQKAANEQGSVDSGVRFMGGGSAARRIVEAQQSEALRESLKSMAAVRKGLQEDLMALMRAGGQGQSPEASRLREEIKQLNEQAKLLEKALMGVDAQFALAVGRTNMKDSMEALRIEKQQYETTLASLQENVRIKDTMQARLQLQAFEEEYTKKRLDREEFIAGSQMAILAGVFDARDALIDIDEIRARTATNAEAQTIVFEKMSKAERDSINEMADFVAYQQRLLDGTTVQSVKLSSERSKLNDMQKKFNDLLEASIALGAVDAKATTAEILAAGKNLSVQQRTVQTAAEQVKYIDLGLEALKDKALLSKEEQQAEFLRLSQGRSLAQLQAEMAKLKAQELELSRSMALVEKARLEAILLMPWAVDIAVKAQKGMTAELEKERVKVLEHAGRLAEAMRAAPKTTGGGRDRKEKNPFEEVLGDPQKAVTIARDGMRLVITELETQRRELLRKEVTGKNEDGSDSIMFHLVVGDTQVLSRSATTVLSQVYEDMSRFRTVAAKSLEKGERAATVDETFSRLLFGGSMTRVRAQVGEYMQGLVAAMNASGTSAEERAKLADKLGMAQDNLTRVEQFTAALEQSGMAASVFGAAATEAQQALKALVGTQDELLTTAARPSDAEVIFTKMMLGVDTDKLKERLTAEIADFKQLLATNREKGADVTYIEQMLGEKQRVLQDLEFYLDVMGRAKKGLTEFGDGFRLALGGSKDLIGDDVSRALDSISESALALGEALGAADASTYGIFTAAMPAMRGFFHEFVKDRKARAGIEAAMNAAAAWAAWPNVPQMIAHGTAATMYGLIAGGVGLRLPTAASSARKKDSEGNNMGPVHLHYYGDPVSTEADRGVLVERLLADARADGRFA